MSKEKELRIRNSTAEFLIFTRQAGEDGIEVRVASIARREGSVSGFPRYCRGANSNEAETRAEHIDPVPTKARPLAYNVVDHPCSNQRPARS
jgi:hypothetical protein